MFHLPNISYFDITYFSDLHKIFAKYSHDFCECEYSLHRYIVFVLVDSGIVDESAICAEVIQSEHKQFPNTFKPPVEN